MHFARRQLNATLLPDGRALVTGGSSGAGFNDATAPVFEPEVRRHRGR
jgi:galactose oxidase